MARLLCLQRLPNSNTRQTKQVLGVSQQTSGWTTLQVVFEGRQINQGKPKLTVIGDLLDQIHVNNRKLK